MKYNTKQFIPFDNNLDRKRWLNRNCYKCKRPDCSSKIKIRESFDTGTIPQKRADWMGISDNKLRSNCDKFMVLIPERKQKDKMDKFIYNMF